MHTMETAVARLRESLSDLLQYYPLVLRNVFQSTSLTNSNNSDNTHTPAPPASSGAAVPHDANHMADAVEGFLTELTRALSIGLREGAGFELWSVLELLECVPDRMQAAAEAERRTAKVAADRSPKLPCQSGSVRTPVASVSSSQRSPAHVSAAAAATTKLMLSTAKSGTAATPPTRYRDSEAEAASTAWQDHLQRFHFAAQLVYVVRSTFPAAPRPLQARILLRLALNQGCLLAALELLRRWCRTELEGFYEPLTAATAAPPQHLALTDENHLQMRRSSDERTAAGTPSTSRQGEQRQSSQIAFLVQPDTDSDVWNSFVAALAPVGGPPVCEIAAGAPKVAAQPFHLQLVVAGLDDDSAASLEYYTQLQSYLRGRRTTRPSALVCYETSQQCAARRAAAASATLVVSTARAEKTAEKAAFERPLASSADAAAAEGLAAAVCAAERRASAVPALQTVLQVESLPVSRATPRHDGENSDSARVSSEGNAVRSAGSSHSTRQHRRRRRKKHARTSEAEGATEKDGEVLQTGEKNQSSVEEEDWGECHGVADWPSTASRSSAPLGRRDRSRCSSSSSSFAISSHEHKHHHHKHSASPRAAETHSEAHRGDSDNTDSALSTVPVAPPPAADKAVPATMDADTEEQEDPQRQPSIVTVAPSDLSVVTTAIYNEEAPSTGRGFTSSVRANDEKSTALLPQLLPNLPVFLRGAELTSEKKTLSSASANAFEAAFCVGMGEPLSPDLANLQARVLQCWRVAVAHAESQERKRLLMRDVDANDVSLMQ